jgi:glycosyltransferase involved in cell wall biosynthesis
VIPAWLETIAALAQQHEVHAFVLRHLEAPSTYTLAGATIHDLGRPGGRWAMWRALRVALAKVGPFDVLHGYWADPAGLLTALAGRRLGVTTIVTCDSGEFVGLPDIDYGLQLTVRGRVAVALACRLATRVHVTSRFMQAFARRHGYEAQLVPIGIDVASRVRAQAPPEGPPWRLLQVASLNRVKDHRTALRALAIARRNADLRLDLVGEDTLDGRLQREAEALGIADAVTFHGFLSQDQLPPLHAAAHLYLQSSRHEAAGISVLEAAAAQIPVVGTNVGFVHDWAPDAARALPVSDPDAMAAAILSLLGDPAARRSMMRHASEIAVAYDVSRTAASLGEMYVRATETRRHEEKTGSP